jgi:branched-chain amino acid transport system ATP-binding protein
VLSLDNVSTRYGEIRMLQRICIRIGDKQIVSIIGSNGSGKSTLLNTISGLIVPDEGEILYRGQSLVRVPVHEFAAKGIVQAPEGRRVFGEMTVEENLKVGAYAIKSRKSARETMSNVYSLFPRLFERRNQVSATLSGGEQQMLAIGRALMAQPSLLMLDEPSMGLSPMMVSTVFEKIMEINRQGIAVLLVEQNAFTALRISRYAYVLETGRIILEGSGTELLHDDRVRKAYLGED